MYSGRAGRDGAPACSIVYYSKSDADKKLFLINKEHESEATPDAKEKHKAVLKSFNKLIDYCQNLSCRRRTILQFFGETPKFTLQSGCASCDYCKDPKKVARTMEQLLKAGSKEYRTSTNLMEGFNIVPAATKRKRFESFDEETAQEAFEKIKKACVNKEPPPPTVIANQNLPISSI